MIDDARTPLIISGPVPKGDDQLFEEFCPKVEALYKAQRAYTTKLLAEARTKIASSERRCVKRVLCCYTGRLRGFLRTLH